jgi:hypothetical protein
LYTEANDDRDRFGQTHKRINLYLNKNPLVENNKIHNSDKKSTFKLSLDKGLSNSHLNKTTSKSKAPLSRDKKSSTKPNKTLVTEPYEKKSLYFSKAESKLVDQLFGRDRKPPSQK